MFARKVFVRFLECKISFLFFDPAIHGYRIRLLQKNHIANIKKSKKMTIKNHAMVKISAKILTKPTLKKCRRS